MTMVGTSVHFEVILASIHAFAALYMCGLIWFVQVVHYPLHGLVGMEAFQDYQAAHVRRTSLVVIGPMLIEFMTAGLLVAVSWSQTFDPLAAVGFLVLLKAWVATFMLSVPAHRKLEAGFSQAAHRQLVLTNWVRTFAWTVRAPIALAILVSASKGMAS